MKIRHYLVFGAAALVLAASFFLPNAVAGVTDMRRFDNLIITDTQSISLDATPELSLIDRLALAGNTSTESLPLKTGNAMDNDAAVECVYRELERFSRLSPWKVDFGTFVAEEGAASLMIDTMIPALNMVVWDFTLTDPSDNALMVTIDDEMGVILRLVFRWRIGNLGQAGTGGSDSSAPTDAELFAIASSLTEMMTDYYGQPVELADYLFSETFSYYKAEISGGRDHAIPLYGVVRMTGFTMNERV